MKVSEQSSHACWRKLTVRWIDRRWANNIVLG